MVSTLPFPPFFPKVLGWRNVIFQLIFMEKESLFGDNIKGLFHVGLAKVSRVEKEKS